ncbi:hypothetical protein KL911_002422 [Ogataea haglerorum]|uniref:uncharacterized protein n=1 Tax=Ogataea haglerorum TaxID=1937702 RepID=UPI001C8A73BE|nr:uncharacterized protein KL911_002422 [Ogataea haglerorum]KAG7753946.1 hypothetical protein KL911_002422 [Ogataea haglerorum]
MLSSVKTGADQQHAEQLAQRAAGERERCEEEADAVRELEGVQKRLVRAEFSRFGVQPQALGDEALGLGLVAEQQREVEVVFLDGLLAAWHKPAGHLADAVGGRDAVVALRERAGRGGVREAWRADRRVSEGRRVLAGDAALCAGRAGRVGLVAPGFSLFAREARETGYHEVRNKKIKLISCRQNAAEKQPLRLGVGPHNGLQQPPVDRHKLVVVHHLVLEHAVDLARGQHGPVLAVLRKVQCRKQHEELEQVAAPHQQHDVRLLEDVDQLLALVVEVLDQLRVQRRQVRSPVQHHLGEAVGDDDHGPHGVLLEQVLPVVERRLEVLERRLERLLELQRVVQREQDRELADDAAVEARRGRDVQDVAALVEPQRVDQARPARQDAVAQVRERELVPEPEALDAVRVHLEAVRQQVQVHLARDVVQQRVARQEPAVEVEGLVRERDGKQRNQQERLDLVLCLRDDEERRREQPLDRVQQRAREHVHVLRQEAAVEAQPQQAQHGEQQRALRAQLADVVVRHGVDAAPEAVEVDGEPHELAGERLGQQAAGDDVGVGGVREHERPDPVGQFLVEGDLGHVAGASHVPERRDVEVELVEQV